MSDETTIIAERDRGAVEHEPRLPVLQLERLPVLSRSLSMLRRKSIDSR
jgi:hypothetical protein